MEHSGEGDWGELYHYIPVWFELTRNILGPAHWTFLSGRSAQPKAIDRLGTLGMRTSVPTSNAGADGCIFRWVGIYSMPITESICSQLTAHPSQLLHTPRLGYPLVRSKIRNTVSHLDLTRESPFRIV